MTVKDISIRGHKVKPSAGSRRTRSREERPGLGHEHPPGWRVTRKKPVRRGTAAGLAAGHATVRQTLEAAGIRRHYRNYPDPRLADWQGAYFPGV